MRRNSAAHLADTGLPCLTCLLQLSGTLPAALARAPELQEVKLECNNNVS